MTEKYQTIVDYINANTLRGSKESMDSPVEYIVGEDLVITAENLSRWGGLYVHTINVRNNIIEFYDDDQKDLRHVLYALENAIYNSQYSGTKEKQEEALKRINSILSSKL